MGRPKKLLFPCTYCDKAFKRKAFLKKHLLSHPDFTNRSTRTRSNWCHVCRKSFAKSDYKLHILNEHQYDTYGAGSPFSSSEGEDLGQSNSHKGSSTEDFLIRESIYLNPVVNIKKEIDKTTFAKTSNKNIANPSKKLQIDPGSLSIKIKTEPADMCETNAPLRRGRKLGFKVKSIICKICGIKCKNLRGLKIHLSATHKRNSVTKCKVEESKTEKTFKTVKIKTEPTEVKLDQMNSCVKSCSAQPVLTYNTTANFGQNAQTGLIYNVLPMQNQPMNSFFNIGNQPNLQIPGIQPNLQIPGMQPNLQIPGIQPNLQIPGIQPSLQILGNQPSLQIPSTENSANQNEPFETIQNFDPDSETYIKWIKKFINKCKMHKYPLTPTLCMCVNEINEHITKALNNPEESLKKRSNHFYFMKIKSLLSEIMLGQLRYSINVIQK